MIKKISEQDFQMVRKRINTQVAADIHEFMQSDDTVCEVVASNYKTIESARNAYKVAAKRCGYAVNLTACNDRLFMFKEEK